MTCTHENSKIKLRQNNRQAIKPQQGGARARGSGNISIRLAPACLAAYDRENLKMEFLLDYESDYWKDINAKIKNDYGTAGLMGNLMAESGLIPYRKQNDNTPPYLASQEYTNAVDSGSYTENQFVNDGIGYGLAQWTFSGRKQQLYEFKREMSVSIGSYELSLKMLFYELEGGYRDTLDVLSTAKSVREASDYVLHNYEQPADQSVEVEKYRESLGMEIYSKYAGTLPPDPPIPPHPGNQESMPLWLYFFRR